MSIAYANNGSAAGGFAAFIPLLIIGCIFGVFYMKIADRKGRSKTLWFLTGFVPLWNILGGFWLASLPEKAILDEVKDLLKELKKYDFVPKSDQAQIWSCNCGTENDMDTLNCAECGLKRDYVLKTSN